MSRRARGVLGAAVPFLIVVTGLIGVGAPVGAVVSDAYAQAVVASGPTAYLRLGDAASPAVDEKGVVPGALSGGVVTGVPGAVVDGTDTAMRFDGVNDYVSLGNGPALRPQLFSVELWFRASAPRPARMMLARWRTFGWSAVLNVDSVRVGVYGASGFEHVARWFNPFDDGAWHHLVGVRDATTLRLYVDGIERASVEAPPTTRYETGGAALARDGNNPADYFKGDLDEFALYPAPLSAEQVVTHYCASGVESSLCNHAPVAVATDQVVVEGSTVTLDASASTDEDGDALTASWELLSSEGPAITLDDPTSPNPSFTALDDGSYAFRLTVDDGQETSQVDVTVTVVNAPPVVTLVETGTDAPGSAAVEAAVSDPGPLDTTTLQYDFGDGAPIATLDAGAVAAFGAGATHRYAQAGSYPVTALVADDDGDTASASIVVDVASRVPSASLFASSSGRMALDVRFDDSEVAGRVHSNGGIRLDGHRSSLIGGTESTAGVLDTGHRMVIDPAAVVTGPEDGDWVGVDEYRPGAPGALAAGDAYFDVSSSCNRKGVWRPSTPLAPGLYYARCDVELSDEMMRGPVTIAAEGTIDLDAVRGGSLTPYLDDVLLVSGAASAKAITVRARWSAVEGAIVAWSGTVRVEAKEASFACGIAGGEVVLDAKRVAFAAPACG